MARMTGPVSAERDASSATGGADEAPLHDIRSWAVVRCADGGDPGVGWRSLWADENLAVDASPASPPLFRLRFPGIALFELSFAAREIKVWPLGAALSPSTIEHLLADQIWPRLIAHQGHLVLHAAGVATPAGAVLIAGPSGRGKSTLTASLHQRGFALLGDDAMVVGSDGGQPSCRAVYPSMRLFPDSIANLFGADVRHSEVAHYSAKRNLDLSADPSTPEMPLRALFFIAADSDCANPRVIPLTPSATCMGMVEHSFWLDPLDLALTARKVRTASAIAAATPAFTLDYPRSFARLDDVHSALFAALAAV